MFRGRGLNYEVALFPLNDPLTPTTFEVACNGASALHAVYDKETQANFKIYEQTYHASKFSKLLRRVNKVLKFANLFIVI